MIQNTVVTRSQSSFRLRFSNTMSELIGKEDSSQAHRLLPSSQTITVCCQTFCLLTELFSKKSVQEATFYHTEFNHKKHREAKANKE